MPIRPEERDRYLKDWKAISRRIGKDRVGDRCEGDGCGAINGQPHPLTSSRVVLTVAHLDHTPESCADASPKALCQRCHKRHDGPNRRAGIRRRARLRLAIGDLFEAPAAPPDMTVRPRRGGFRRGRCQPHRRRERSPSPGGAERSGAAAQRLDGRAPAAALGAPSGAPLKGVRPQAHAAYPQAKSFRRKF